MCYKEGQEAFDLLRCHQSKSVGQCQISACPPRYLFRRPGGKGFELLWYIYGGVRPPVPESKDSLQRVRYDFFRLSALNERLDTQVVRERRKNLAVTSISTGCRKWTQRRVSVQSMLEHDCTGWHGVHEMRQGNGPVSSLSHWCIHLPQKWCVLCLSLLSVWAFLTHSDVKGVQPPWKQAGGDLGTVSLDGTSTRKDFEALYLHHAFKTLRPFEHDTHDARNCLRREQIRGTTIYCHSFALVIQKRRVVPRLGGTLGCLQVLLHLGS